MPVGDALGPAAICGTVVSGGGAVVPGAAGPGAGVPAVLGDGPAVAGAGVEADAEADAEAAAEADGAADVEAGGVPPVGSSGEGPDDAGEPAATASPPQPTEPPRDRTGVPFNVSAPSARSG